MAASKITLRNLRSREDCPMVFEPPFLFFSLRVNHCLQLLLRLIASLRFVLHACVHLNGPNAVENINEIFECLVVLYGNKKAKL